jgi:DnaJ like chaperone protein
MPRLAEVVTQTFRSFSPGSLSDRLFGNTIEDWWHEYAQTLEATAYTGKVQTAFFITTFAAMGRISKIDGRIHESEIGLANKVMDHLKLDASQKKLAIRLFNEGKQSDFNLDTVLNRFHRLCGHRVSVIQVFIEIQLQTAFADGAMNEKEESLLKSMCKRLDISDIIYKRIERRVRKNKYGDQAPHVQPPRPMSLSEACTVLDISRWAKKEDIKKAYRRLLSQFHPDKLIAQHATEDELEEATDKVQEVKRAYDIVSRAKKIR